MIHSTQFEDRASSSRSQHERESSRSLCDRLSQTRDISQRQLPTDQDYAVSTREYQTDQSSPKTAPVAAGPVLEKQQQKQPLRWAAVDRSLHIRDSESQEKRHHAKSKLIEVLKGTGESWAEWVEFVPEKFLAEGVAQLDGRSKSRFEMVLGTKEHEMHHLGQLTVIERMLGIVPHLTRVNSEAQATEEKSE